jgi:glycerate-2-kinase
MPNLRLKPAPELTHPSGLVVLSLRYAVQRRDGGWKKIHLIAFGKAACTVAKAAQEVIPAHLFNGTWHSRLQL